jgi:hypothetical protein
METALVTQYNWDSNYIKLHSSTEGVQTKNKIVRSSSPNIDSLFLLILASILL